MTTIERILIRLGREALQAMTPEQAALSGYSVGAEWASHLRDCFSESTKSDTQTSLPRTDDAQPVGGDIIAARMAKPSMSAILPRRPDDVPAPPEGWDYVGNGREENSNALPTSDIALHTECWNIEGEECCGHLTGWHYAIRRTAAPDIWHRFGLLAPDEGGGFYPHTPGDPMPCDGDMRVDFLAAAPRISPNAIARACVWDEDSAIIGWRPALGGAK
jgi:hypothetical protein